jgi:hypothetical protein
MIVSFSLKWSLGLTVLLFTAATPLSAGCTGCGHEAYEGLIDPKLRSYERLIQMLECETGEIGQSDKAYIADCRRNAKKAAADSKLTTQQLGELRRFIAGAKESWTMEDPTIDPVRGCAIGYGPRPVLMLLACPGYKVGRNAGAPFEAAQRLVDKRSNAPSSGSAPSPQADTVTSGSPQRLRLTGTWSYQKPGVCVAGRDYKDDDLNAYPLEFNGAEFYKYEWSGMITGISERPNGVLAVNYIDTSEGQQINSSLLIRKVNNNTMDIVEGSVRGRFYRCLR